MTNLKNWDSAAYEVGSYMQSVFVDHVLAHYKFNDAEAILDLGCGDGNNTIKVANMAPRASVVGMDWSPEQIAAAKKKHSDKSNVSFMNGDISKLNCNEQYDSIVSFFLLGLG